MVDKSTQWKSLDEDHALSNDGKRRRTSIISIHSDHSELSSTDDNSVSSDDEDETAEQIAPDPEDDDEETQLYQH